MAQKPVRILLVEDNRGDALLLREHLAMLAPFELVHVETLQDGLSRLTAEHFDILLLDLNLPDSEGLDTVDKVLAQSPQMPIVVFTAVASEHIGNEAVHRGVQDYLVKGRLTNDIVTRAIRYAIERKKTEQQLRQARDELERRVQERTVELEHAIEALQDEFDMRIKVENSLLQAERTRLIQLQNLAMELTQVEQKEKNRLAHILHDNLQQILVGAKYRLESLRRKKEFPKIRKAVQQVDHILDESIEVSRSLTMELSPPVLRTEGLSAAIKWLADWMKSKFNLDVRIRVDIPMEPAAVEIRYFAFHAVRELLFNVVKHSNVKTASVILGQDKENHLLITVEDAGKGFNLSTMQVTEETARGFGLCSIRERLRLLGGQMDIKTSPGHGTRISMEIPLCLELPHSINQMADD